MHYYRIAAIAMLLLLTGCLKQTQEDLAQCKAAADVTYKSVTQMPLGEPYKDIYACMWTDGYELDTSVTSRCRGADYVGNSMNAICYRPRNIISGYFFDMGSLIR